jgi:hypothetical protein
MQNREVDAAKAGTPSVQIINPYNISGKSMANLHVGGDASNPLCDAQGSSVGDGGPYQGKKKGKGGRGGKKSHGDRLLPSDQPKALSEKSSGNGTIHKYKCRDDGANFNKFCDDIGFLNNPGGPGSFNRSNTFRENPMPRSQFHENQGIRSYGAYRRRTFTERAPINLNPKIAPDNDNSLAAICTCSTLLQSI